jgi:hypothetical protein
VANYSLRPPIAFGTLNVAPVIHDLLAAYPEVTGRLVLSDGVIDLVENHIDVAVRIGRLPDSALVARRVVGEVSALAVNIRRRVRSMRDCDSPANHPFSCVDGKPRGDRELVDCPFARKAPNRDSDGQCAPARTISASAATRLRPPISQVHDFIALEGASMHNNMQRAVERLDLAFLVDGQHRGVAGWDHSGSRRMPLAR